MNNTEIVFQLQCRRGRIHNAMDKLDPESGRELAFRELLRAESSYVDALIDFRQRHGDGFDDLCRKCFN